MLVYAHQITQFFYTEERKSMSEKQEHRRRFYQKVQYVAEFENWLREEPPFFRFIKWHRWKKRRPTMWRA